MSDVVPVRSDRCGLDELFLAWGIGEAERGRLALDSQWTRRWASAWRTSGGEVACAVRDLASVSVAWCEPVRRFSWRQRQQPGLEFLLILTGTTNVLRTRRQKRLEKTTGT